MNDENKIIDLAEEDLENASGGNLGLEESGSGKNTMVINEYFVECERKNLNISDDFKAWLNSK